MSVILSSIALAHTLVKTAFDARELMQCNIARPLRRYLRIRVGAHKIGSRVVERDKGGFKKVLSEACELPYQIGISEVAYQSKDICG